MQIGKVDDKLQIIISDKGRTYKYYYRTCKALYWYYSNFLYSTPQKYFSINI